MTSLGAALARTHVISTNFAACWARRKKADRKLILYMAQKMANR